tara:strand:- start:195 stop:563 length:369 start_codon:yes stop_codon:yes gene_type:complete
MGPERKLYQNLKRNTPTIKWNRIENLALLGCPDLLGYNTSGHFFTVELKVTKGNRIKFSPHQIAFHKTHPKNTFILAQALGPRCLKLFPGSAILELEALGYACDLAPEASWATVLEAFELVA